MDILFVSLNNKQITDIFYCPNIIWFSRNFGFFGKFLFTLHSFCQDERFLDIWIFDVNDHLMFNIPNYHHIWFSRMFGLFWKCYVNLSSFSLGLWINGYSDVRIIRISKKERDYWIFYMQPSRSSISYSLIAFKYLGFQDFWIDLEVYPRTGCVRIMDSLIF